MSDLVLISTHLPQVYFRKEVNVVIMRLSKMFSGKSFSNLSTLFLVNKVHVTWTIADLGTCGLITPAVRMPVFIFRVSIWPGFTSRIKPVGNMRALLNCRMERNCSVGFVDRLGVRRERKRSQGQLQDFFFLNLSCWLNEICI